MEGLFIFVCKFGNTFLWSKDKKLNLFENGYHELHNDVEYLEMRKNILDWCNERVDKSQHFGIFWNL